MGQQRNGFRLATILAASSLFWVGCGKSDSVDSGPSNTSQVVCQNYSGTPWAPEVTGVGAANHNSSVSVEKSTYQATGTLVGLDQASSGKEITVSFSVGNLGPRGSFTLVGKVTGFPTNLSGAASAYLVSLKDPNNKEYINLKSECLTNGFYNCSTSPCTLESSCTIVGPSAYPDRSFWEQHQGDTGSAENVPSVNVFPTCNWTGGDGSEEWPQCAFTTDLNGAGSKFFSSGQLAQGTYTAKYILMADSYAQFIGTYQGTLSVDVIKKTNTSSSVGGAVDLNVILVGADNIKASRTERGKQNLNTMIKAVHDYYNQTDTEIKLGRVNAFEWGCSPGGDDYANLDLAELSTFFSTSKSFLSSDTDGKALNLFITSSIYEDASSNLTILGYAGAIGGPPQHGTAVSGVVVSSFNDLDQFNTGKCNPSSGTTCPITQQESDYFDWNSTVAHEIGHYLGLNHLSESRGTAHDQLPDTPYCSYRASGTSYITRTNCSSSSNTALFPSSGGSKCSSQCPSPFTDLCPTALACQFNYVMWWTSKLFNESVGQGDGNLFSAGEGSILNYHPLVQ